MKTTIIYGPAASGKTILAHALGHALNMRAGIPRFGISAPGDVEDECVFPDGEVLYRKKVAELKRKARNRKRGFLVLVVNARPPDDALALADYIVETRAKGAAK